MSQQLIASLLGFGLAIPSAIALIWAIWQGVRTRDDADPAVAMLGDDTPKDDHDQTRSGMSSNEKIIFLALTVVLVWTAVASMATTIVAARGETVSVSGQTSAKCPF